MSPAGFIVLWPDVGLKGTMNLMAGRKRHSAEDIVRKLRRADELAAEGKTGEEIAAELGVSAATLYNWRRAYGGIDTDAARELKELREQNSRLKAAAGRGRTGKGCPARGGQGKILSPAAKRRAVDMLTSTLRMSERLLAGMWQLIAEGIGGVPRTLLWDNESGIGQRGRLAEGVSGFCGVLGTRLIQARPYDPLLTG